MNSETLLRAHQLHCHSLWLAAEHNRGEDGLLPDRHEMSVFDLKPALGWVIIVEVTEDALRYRLVGTEVVARTGYDMTRKNIVDFPHAWQVDLMERAYSAVLARRKPMVCARSYQPAKVFGDHSLLLLPCAKDGLTIDTVIAVMAPLDNLPSLMVSRFEDLDEGAVQQDMFNINSDLTMTAA